MFEEVWANIPDFPGYQVSTEGRVRSFWRVPHHGRGAKRILTDKPYIMPMSDDGNGYLKVCLMRDGKNYMKKVHRLVAEVFIQNTDPDNFDTIDHIISGPEGKLDNSIHNLQWMSRGDNIRKAWKDGMCEARRRQACRSIIATDLYDDYRMYFPSIKETASRLCLNEDSLRHGLSKYGCFIMESPHTHYQIEYADLEDDFLYGGDEWEIDGGLAYYGGFHY